MGYRWTLTNLSNLDTEVLSKDPIGWDDGTYSIKRSEVYKGAFHEYTTSLKFHCNGGGKAFVDNVYATEDIDGRIEVLVEYDCDGSGTYDELFEGIINLASYRNDGEYTIVNIEKSDLLTKLYSRDEISVDLETTTSIGGETITAPTPTTIALHSQNIFLESGMSSQDEITKSVTLEVADSVIIRGFVSHGLTTDISEAEQWAGWTDYSDVALNGPTASTSFLPEIFSAISNDVEYPDTYTYRTRFTGTFHDILVTGETRINAAHSLSLRYGPTLASSTAITLWTNGGAESYSTTDHSHAFDTGDLVGTIALNYGDKVWLGWFVSETISTGPYLDDITFEWSYTEARFSLEINSLAEPTTAKSMLVHEAFNQVVDAIADSNNNFESDFYGRTDSEKITYPDDGCGSKIGITNGLNLRKIDKPITASFKQLFDAFDCLHNIGMGIVDGKVRIEPLEYFFDASTKVITLPNVGHFDIKNDNRRYINKIDIGYQKWESEFLGGLDEVCAKHEYSTEISSTKNTLSRLSDFIASGYTIEFTRRKWNDHQTEDWRYDNDNFVISATQAPYVYEVTGQWLSTSILVLSGTDFDIQVGDVIDTTGTASNNGTFTVIAKAFGFFNTTLLAFAEATVAEASGSFTITKNVALSSIKWRAEKYGDGFSYGSGMTSINTAYNLRLTPARMLLAHMNVITAGLQIKQGQIRFVKGEGNTDLQCSATVAIYTDGCQEEYKSQQLHENQNFAWNDSNVLNITPIWLPEIYSFSYPLTYTQFKTIKANPYGYIEFYKFSDEVKTGFILNMDYSMKTGLTKFELLKRYQ